MLVAIDCLKPFAEQLKVELGFAIGATQYSYEIPLPVTLASFFEAKPSDKPTYMSRWKVLENEVQEIFVTSKTLDLEYLMYIRNVLFTNLKIGLASELDATERTSTGTFAFHAASPNGDGTSLAVGGMLRLEADPSQSRFRITIRAKSLLLSEAVRDLFKLLLA